MTLGENSERTLTLCGLSVNDNSIPHFRKELNKDRRELFMRRSKNYYKKLFAKYPDLVTVVQFREMLGGIGDCFARKLIREKRVASFYIKPFYYVSKSSIIDYVLSEDYAERNLKVRV